MSQTTHEDICLTGVSKIFRLGLFKTKVAVEDLSFAVAPGEVAGLLGPNGSGKSTTLKMILGFLKPTSGEILVCGHGTHERIAKTFIGYLPENPRFQKFLTANEALQYFGKLHTISSEELRKRVAYLLELVGLKHAANERIQGFSKGMTQRLAIAQALLNRPRLLIFDEPMSGLDPLGRKEMRKLIAEIHREMPKSTIFFSTHILTDVEQLCSSVILLKNGRLTKQCPIEELLQGDCQNFEVTVRGLTAEMSEKFPQKTLPQTNALGTTLRIEGTETLIRWLSELRRTGATIVAVASQRKSLEEALFSEPTVQQPPKLTSDGSIQP